MYKVSLIFYYEFINEYTKFYKNNTLYFLLEEKERKTVNTNQQDSL